jgi:hypothetical protein
MIITNEIKNTIVPFTKTSASLSEYSTIPYDNINAIKSSAIPKYPVGTFIIFPRINPIKYAMMTTAATDAIGLANIGFKISPQGLLGF